MDKTRILLATVLVFALVNGVSLAHEPRPDAPPYALRGDYTVGVMDFSIADDTRPLELSVWYPADNPDGLEESTIYLPGTLLELDGRAIANAPADLSAAPYPLVIFSHGSSGFRFQSRFFTEHLASHGFIVIAADHPTNTLLESLNAEAFTQNLAPNYIYRPQDVLRLVDFAEILTAADGALSGAIDMDNIALTGHSFGGYTALATSGIPLNFDSLAAWCEDATENPDLLYGTCFLLDDAERIASTYGLDSAPSGAFEPFGEREFQAVIAFAPWNGAILDPARLATSTTPTMIVVGTADEVTPPERDAFVIYEQLTSTPRSLVTFENAGHYIYVDECWDTAIAFGFYDSCSDDVWDMTRAHDILNHLSTAFLLAELYNNADAAAAFEAVAVDFTGVIYDTNQ